MIELEQVRPWSDLVDLSNMIVMLSIICYSAIKLGCLHQGYLFVSFGGSKEFAFFCNCFDTVEVLVHSPRFLAVWTMAFMSKVRFLGTKESLGAMQFTVLRYLPVYVAWEASIDHLIRQQLVVTLDDIVWLMLFIIAMDCENKVSANQSSTNGILLTNFFQPLCSTGSSAKQELGANDTASGCETPSEPLTEF